MLLLSMVLLGACCAVDMPANDVMPLRVVGPWTVEIGPGKIEGRQAELTEAKTVAILPPERISVRDEAHPNPKIFDDKAPGWLRGERMNRLAAEECTVTGRLYPESVKIKSGRGGDAIVYTLGKDYQMDGDWAQFGRIVGGGIPEGQTVYVDYDYGPDRLDSLVLTAAKEASLRQGNSSLPLVNPTEYVLKDEVVLANVFVPGRCVALTDENLYPIHYRTGRPPAKHSDAAEKLLPKTLAKLRSGEPLTYIAWGDSVTNGGGVGAHKEQWYQTMFVNELKTRFPKANITLITAAWPGGNSSGYMSAPSGGPYVYQRDVLDPKPDLVSIEFVNDAGLDEASVQAHYGQILADLRGVGAETILITPHLVRPDWMNCTTLKFDEDPRPYVRGLRQFAATNNVALADASRLWCLLYRQGIPYTKILANDINHPDVRGHQLFVDALMALFPAR